MAKKTKNCLLRKLPQYRLIRFANSNFANDFKNCKLVISYYFFSNRLVVLWCNKKQKTVSMSITKAKYISLHYRAKKALWIMQVINKIELEIVESLTLYGNHKISIELTNNIES